jgi:uncharacterized membrane protein YhaH (DUF805 family)
MSDRSILGGVMNFNQAVSSVLTNYANFKGGASRSEFWYWIVFLAVWTLAFEILSQELFEFFRALFIVYVCAMLSPSLAVGVRRMRDAGSAGVLYLVVMIAVLAVLVWRFFAW